MWHRYINQALIYKSRPDIIYLGHIYKSDRYLAKSASYLYIRGGYTNIAFVSIFDTFGTPYDIATKSYNRAWRQTLLYCALQISSLEGVGKAYLRHLAMSLYKLKAPL